jgi:hypothetical protein
LEIRSSNGTITGSVRTAEESSCAPMSDRNWRDISTSEFERLFRERRLPCRVPADVCQSAVICFGAPPLACSTCPALETCLISALFIGLQWLQMLHSASYLLSSRCLRACVSSGLVLGQSSVRTSAKKHSHRCCVALLRAFASSKYEGQLCRLLHIKNSTQKDVRNFKNRIRPSQVCLPLRFILYEAYNAQLRYLPQAILSR